MTSGGNPQPTRDPLSIVLAIIVAVSLLAAVFFLALMYPPATGDVSPTVPPIITPGGGGEGTGGETNGGTGQPTEPTVTPDDLRELALALAAVITALSGLFGLVATQIWRRREESRADKSHALALERERLELERERLQLERDRLELERQRQALQGGQ